MKLTTNMGIWLLSGVFYFISVRTNPTTLWIGVSGALFGAIGVVCYQYDLKKGLGDAWSLGSNFWETALPFRKKRVDDDMDVKNLCVACGYVKKLVEGLDICKECLEGTEQVKNESN